jgi:hypothetical protein
MKKWVVYSAIIAFFLAYNNWETFYTGVISYLFAFVFTLFNFWLFECILKLVGEYYGISIELQGFKIKKETTKFSHKIKEIIVSEKKMPLDFIATLLLGLATSGFVFPVMLTAKFSTIEAKRIGKTEDLEIKYAEKGRIIIFGIVILWLLFSIIKTVSFLNPVVQAYISFTYHFIAMLTWSALTPFNLLLSYLLVERFGYEFTGISLGDILIFSKTPYYKAVIASLVFLPIVGVLLDPFSLLIIILAIFSLVWSREKFKEAFS